MLRPTVSQTQQVTSYLVPCLKELDQFITGFGIVDASFSRAHKTEEIGVKIWGRATSAFGPGTKCSGAPHCFFQNCNGKQSVDPSRIIERINGP